MTMRNLSGWLIRGTMILAFVALVALGFSRFLSLRARMAAAKPPLPAVRTIEARSPAQGTVLRTIPAIATVESHASIRVPVQMAGRLVSLSHREGDRVKAGDELARIDPDEPSVQKGAADAQVAAAGGQLESVKAALAALVSQREALQANLAFQKAEEERDRALFEGGAISQSQWDASKNRRIDAESRLKAMDEQIRSSRAQQGTISAQQQAARKSADLWKIRQDYSVLRAPVDGVITARLQEEGQFVMPGTPVYVLEDTRETRLRLQIPQNRSSELVPGQLVCLSDEEFAFLCPETETGTGSSSEATRFRLDRIHPQVNEFRQVIAEAAVPSAAPALLVGRQLPARVVVRQMTGLTLEAGMLFPDLASPGAWVVYEVAGGMANRRAIVPEMIGDDGRAVVSPAQVRSDARFLVAPYLAHVRLPASFPVEVAP
ncbi:MAG TPA: HlyD family efflux transporter periplasmic adaptor subunit [Candidatus Ozemobacteraceae bacterium]|nr:HlyD family efflux transporter periplasmic adaptor subunit [Candidatus Ozemobacteraceae bacterium]